MLEKRMARTDSQAVNRAEDGIHGDDPQGLWTPSSQERNRGYGSLAGENLAGEISPEEYEAGEPAGAMFWVRALHQVTKLNLCGSNFGIYYIYCSPWNDATKLAA